MASESQQPYKGLASYTEDDAHLFAGRDVDIRRCATFLADSNTRILALHGLTGCGKSSFLRAGIIPYLEDGDTGIAFARRGKTRDVFISSTADPLAKLANAVFEFTSNPLTIQTPTGERKLNLRAALPDPAAVKAAAFVRSAGRDPSVLLGVLERLSLIVPHTLVLIIDQGEEVLTLANPAFESKARDAFFDFLSAFSIARFAMKIVVSLRTEYLGRFASHLRMGFRGTGLSDYYLGELTKSQIKEALQRPAQQFGFTIDEDVIESAIEQLDKVPLGRLGALQIAFSELYSLMRSRQANEITLADLAELGNVEGTIERFVHKALHDRGTALRLPPLKAEQEVTFWKEALCDLLRLQPDGTVTTDIKSEADLEERLAGTLLGFGETTGILVTAGLLKPIKVVDGEGGVVPCFAIGHDTVGLVLWNWKLRREQRSSLSAQAQVVSSREEPDEAPNSPGREIALCLSGGGYRAMLFDLGAVWRLNDLGYLSRLGRVSGVAGGAVVAGVLGMHWNELSFVDGIAVNFSDVIAKPLLEFADQSIDVRSSMLGLLPGRNPADVMAGKMASFLFGEKTLQDLPDQPVFVFSSTNLQRVSLFRFSKSYIGDAVTGIIRDYPELIAIAVAASNALPPTLSPLVLHLGTAKWEPPNSAEFRFREKVYLATGSLIDNLGLEAAWRRHKTIFVCDGGVDSPDNPEPKGGIAGFVEQAVRTVEVLDHQLRLLRRRQVIEALETNNKKGAYWSIRNFEKYGSKISPTRASELAALATRFAPLNEADKRDLVNFGYDVCRGAIAARFENEPPAETLRFPFP
ncbi:patatin-like phospholipase family protein [Bradyrhizobium barranii subsp. apii]|uniref:Patatin-like phospholipase family protein n=1 Tax=Bradyrhizobium barranii subsp. apii TaxID=2819348 RepID=A0A8T5V7W7_9BRAD|nr:patatin-like phospholipase family protein [Bradyrhizobium barranii]UPT83859.1 patatin-like phospholipase family protein [Bradyrhizobium barranii subsp. apii]